VQTFSFFAKEGTLARVNVVVNASVNVTAQFDLANGIVLGGSQNITSSITSVGDGWYRCSVTYNQGTTSRFRLYPVNLAGGGTSGSIYIQDAQLEQGLVATEYIESGASTGKAGILEDSPRFDYSGGASCPSLLLEPSRTNLIPYSEYFDGPYSVFSTTPIFTTNYGTSPQGVINSTRIQLDAADLFGKSPSLTSSNYVFSVFAKKVGLDEIGLRIDYSGGTMTTKFNLSNGTISSSTSDDADIEDYGNGWYRCWILASSKNIGNYVVTAGGVPADCEIYGLQLEQASYPTSYIPNHSGGSVTRGADSCSGAGTSSTFNDSEGVLYVEASALANDGTSRMIALSDATSANHIRIYPTTTNNRITIAIKSGNVNQYVYHYDGLSDITDTWKVAVRYKLNDFATFVNGVKVDSSSSGSVATGLDELQFNGGASANPFYGKSNQVIVFNSYLSNTDLEILTGTSYESFAAMATALNYTTYE
jgi:hypothetical protein